MDGLKVFSYPPFLKNLILYIFLGVDLLTDHISRNKLKRWLQNYESLMTGSPPDDNIPRNSGPRPTDGIPNRVLIKIMLDQALEALPNDLRRVAYFRWLERWPLSVTLEYLAMTKDQYYYRCDKALDYMYHFVNGKPMLSRRQHLLIDNFTKQG